MLFKCIAGSQAYGLADENSDTDYCGIFEVPRTEYLNFYPTPPNQFEGKNPDFTYYSLRRYFELANSANPNILELLCMPNDCIIHKSSVMLELENNRSLFFTQKCYESYCGYAYSQRMRAKGQNKWANNPKPENPPDKREFCKYVPFYSNGQPARPKKCDINLDRYNVSRVEGGHNLYRLYYYGKDAKGVFRGDNIVTESIPIEHETSKFRGLLIFDKDRYEKELKDWRNYRQWVKTRNEKRWRQYEEEKIDFNAKNLSHCYRLMVSCLNIFDNGCPKVRLVGDEREVCLNIKRGTVPFNEITKILDDLKTKVDKSYEKNAKNFEKTCNFKKVNDLYLSLTQ